MDYYAECAEQANDIPDSDEPWRAIVTRLRDVIELQAREIVRLQGCIRTLEQERIAFPCVLAPGEGGHQPAHTGVSVW